MGNVRDIITVELCVRIYLRVGGSGRLYPRCRLGQPKRNGHQAVGARLLRLRWSPLRLRWLPLARLGPVRPDLWVKGKGLRGEGNARCKNDG